MSDKELPSTPLPWGSIADVKNLKASPALASMTLSAIFGERAASIAAWCAIYARQDSDDSGYQLWLAAFKHLKTSDLNTRS